MSVPSWVYKRHAIHGDISQEEVFDLEDFSSSLNKQASFSDFVSTMRLNPKTSELKSAFAAYEKETGKNRNDMSQADISRHVKRVRGTSKQASMGWGEAKDAIGRITGRQHSGREVGLPGGVSLEELEARREDMRDQDKLLNPQVAAQLGAGAGGLYGALKGRSLRRAAAGAVGGFLAGAGGVTGGRMLSSPIENYMDKTIARRRSAQGLNKEGSKEQKASVRNRLVGMTKTAAGGSYGKQIGALMAGAALAPVAGHLAMRGVNAIGNIGAGRRQERDLQRILEVHPDIGRSEDPRVQMAYQSLVRLNPQYAQDPLIAGPLLKNIVESRTDPTNPGSASYVDPSTAGKLTEIYKNQMQAGSAAGGFGDDMRRSMIAGTTSGAGAYGKSLGDSST